MARSVSDAGAAGAARLVAAAGGRGLVALTGAGISTAAGIPDFRGPEGVWTKNPGAERLSTLEAYLGDASVRRAAWRRRLGSPVFDARPTAGHEALVALEGVGLLAAVVTQNTDGLHSKAGHDPARVIEVHGTAHLTECWACQERQATLAVLERVRAGEEDPRCLRRLPGRDGPVVCGGVLKAATVSFGQSLDGATLDRATRAVAAARVLLVVGSRLEVNPVAGLVPLARRRGTAIVIVNGGPTAMDHLADLVVRGDISEVLPRLVPAPGAQLAAQPPAPEGAVSRADRSH